MSNFRRFLSAMPYGHEDYQYLGTWFVSHQRFLIVGFSMGSAIIGVNYWLTNKELSKLDKKVGELQQEVKDLKQEVKDLKQEVKQEVKDLKEEVKDLKQEMKQDIGELDKKFGELQKGINFLLQKK